LVIILRPGAKTFPHLRRECGNPNVNVARLSILRICFLHGQHGLPGESARKPSTRIYGRTTAMEPERLRLSTTLISMRIKRPAVRFWQPQFFSLFAWSSNRHQAPTTHCSYNCPPGKPRTDYRPWHNLVEIARLGSGAERSTSSDSFEAQNPEFVSPKLNKGPSDFDSRQLVTIDAVYPVARRSRKGHAERRKLSC